MQNQPIDPVIREVVLTFVSQMLAGAEEMIAALMQGQKMSRRGAFDLVFSCQVSALASLGSIVGVPPLDWIREVKRYVDELEARTAAGELQIVTHGEGQTGPGPGGKAS